ncbi:helix-turn-helix transcriptional regulator [Vagococcus intermedius]|uniref:Helix-turn-helix domain-containing protein n=1 Tax=Vagococcus intermedius TaxID=2991418 RepID=A0AAF0I8H0_9ENTE|nr:helix-turn-helix transcriptional regulator [Vagococcus intermedius]WEG74385.1 helix-turn-helix domain-containing protein [Vagococcus intermedius]WEG76507.1 helix-turn-helix domain-containing protein [Vagococcus intermedius]
MRTLRDLRQGLNLTQKELADFFEVSDRTIYQMEKDSSNIKDSLLKRYMMAFNISYDNIFLGSEYEIFVFEKRRRQNFEKRIKQKA